MAVGGVPDLSEIAIIEENIQAQNEEVIKRFSLKL